MTLSEWLDKYLELIKDTRSGRTKKAQCAHLKRLLRPLPLSEVTKVRILEYKQRRLSEPLIRNGKPVEGTKIKGATVNREVSCLIAALNLAADEGLCESAPRLKKTDRERKTARERTLTEKEYRDLLEVSPRWLQRVVIAANEAGLDRSVLINMTWPEVRDGFIAVNGGRDKTGGKVRVGISPELNEVLEELRAEYRRTPNTERRVFTNEGRPMDKDSLRRAFDKAVKDGKIEDFQLRDFRHCARTRWAANGLPFEVAEIGLGHKLKGMAGIYTNLTDDHIRGAFQKLFTSCLHRKDAAADAKVGKCVSA